MTGVVYALGLSYSYQQREINLRRVMKHSIQLLGMSVMELNDYIDSVLASNPFLEKHAVKQSNRMTPAPNAGNEIIWKPLF